MDKKWLAGMRTRANVVKVSVAAPVFVFAGIVAKDSYGIGGGLVVVAVLAVFLALNLDPPKERK